MAGLRGDVVPERVRCRFREPSQEPVPGRAVDGVAQRRDEPGAAHARPEPSQARTPASTSERIQSRRGVVVVHGRCAARCSHSMMDGSGMPLSRMGRSSASRILPSRLPSISPGCPKTAFAIYRRASRSFGRVNARWPRQRALLRTGMARKACRHQMTQLIVSRRLVASPFAAATPLRRHPRPKKQRAWPPSDALSRCHTLNPRAILDGQANRRDGLKATRNQRARADGGSALCIRATRPLAVIRAP